MRCARLMAAGCLSGDHLWWEPPAGWEPISGCHTWPPGCHLVAIPGRQVITSIPLVEIHRDHTMGSRYVHSASRSSRDAASATLCSRSCRRTRCKQARDVFEQKMYLSKRCISQLRAPGARLSKLPLPCALPSMLMNTSTATRENMPRFFFACLAFVLPLHPKCVSSDNCMLVTFIAFYAK